MPPKGPHPRIAPSYRFVSLSRWISCQIKQCRPVATVRDKLAANDCRWRDHDAARQWPAMRFDYYFALGLRPDSELVAVGILEVKAPAAGEVEGRLGDPASGRHDALLRRAKIVGIE